MTPLGEPTAGPREASSGEASASLPPAKSESPEPSPSVSEPGPGARQASLLLNLFMSFRHRLLCPQMTPPGSPGPSCPGRRPPTPYAVVGSGEGGGGPLLQARVSWLVLPLSCPRRGWQGFSHQVDQASPPGHSGHLGPVCPLLRGAVLCTTRCSAASLASAQRRTAPGMANVPREVVTLAEHHQGRTVDQDLSNCMLLAITITRILCLFPNSDDVTTTPV